MSHSETTDTHASRNKSFLANRFEFKYILSPRQAIEVEEYLKKVGLVPDSHSKSGPYRVNSFYFDTPTMDDYRDKDGSFLIRKKMRARTYSEHWHNGPERVWLEVKKKRNMNIKKTRVEISPLLWNNILHRNVDISAFTSTDEQQMAAFQEFIYYYQRQLYRPSVIVKYERTAYMAEFLGPVRITFDNHVTACRADHPMFEKHTRSVSGNQVIMEVKFNGKLPWWFKEMVARFDLRRNDFSKYRNAVAIIRGLDRIPISK